MKAYDVVVENTLRYLDELGEGKIDFSIPINNKSREYNGFNFFALNAIKSAKKYKSDIYMTYKELKKLKAFPKKGSKQLPVIFWNFFEKKKVGVDGKEKKEKIFYMKYYKVYNIDDTTVDPKSVESKIKYYNANEIIQKWDVTKTGDLKYDLSEAVRKARAKLGYDTYNNIMQEEVFINFAVAMVMAKTKHKSHIDMAVANLKDILKNDRYKFMSAISRAKKVANEVVSDI